VFFIAPRIENVIRSRYAATNATRVVSRETWQMTSNNSFVTTIWRSISNAKRICLEFCFVDFNETNVVGVVAFTPILFRRFSTKQN